jgi:uncharacterized protein (TIGR03435 family)
MARLAVLRRASPLVLAATLAASGRLATAQKNPADSLPSFEAASIKLHRGTERTRNTILPGGRYSATNVPVRMMMRSAFGVQDFQIVGGPSWINTDGYDVVAKAATDAAPPQLFAMVRQLLEDRFHLATRRETREMPMYRLAAVNPGALGERIRPSSAACGPPSPDTPPRCGIFLGLGEIRGVSATLGQLATTLAPLAGRLVQDRTTMPGTYDFELQFDFPPTPNTDRPSLFAAVREQLGLKLEPTTGPVDVFIIERIERPTED